MLESAKNRLCQNAFLLISVLLLIVYECCEYNVIIKELPRLPLLILVIVSGVVYIFFYRKKDLYCFETLFILLFILSVFFKDLVLNNLFDDSMVSSVYYLTFPSNTENKGLVLQCLGLEVFLFASSKVNNKSHEVNSKFIITTDYSLATKLLGIINGIYILLLFLNGTVISWFHYTNVSSNYSNSQIVYLTIFFLVHSVIEFSRLCEKGCNSFRNFFITIDKFYLLEISLISFVLLISGNRNECLLILFPLLIGYNIFIKRISNKKFLLILAVGILIMAFIGVLRQVGIFNYSKQESVTLFEATRDFGFVDNNTKYLIDYSDKSNSANFKNAIIVIFSCVPFLGGILTSLFDLTMGVRTTEITTNGMQLKSNMDSGLGTSLFGDLYYTGNIIFVIIFMYFLGWLMSTLYNNYMISRKYSIWSLIIYFFMFSNVVYYIRAEWTMPLRYIGFSFFAILMIRPFTSKIKF